ncbi:MAG: TetR/AcrR family transcriptional regulator [Clostridia bacterium]|nr:TetR/AcrR family transcriptional regulator [Clostridia bacterium]
MSRKEQVLPDGKRALQETFLSLYSKKPYEQISIKELCEKSHVARTTFYFHYQNLAELKQALEDELIEGLLEVAESVADGDYTTMDFHLYVGKTLQYIAEHETSFTAFLLDQPSYSFRARWAEGIKRHLLLQYPDLKRRKNSDVYLEGIAALVLTVYGLCLRETEKVDLAQAGQDFMSILAGLGIEPKV